MTAPTPESTPHTSGRVLRTTPLVVAVAALAVVGLAAGLGRPSTPRAVPAALAASAGPAVRDTLFCPDLRTVAGTLRTGVVVGTSTPGTGSVTLQPATATAGSAATPILGSGQTVASYVGNATGPVVLRSTGTLTAGVVAEQIARGNKTTDRGWAEARCEPARTDQWFVGAATEAGDTPTVILANPGDTRAIVSVSVLTPAGLVTAPTGSNLVLAPHAAPTRIPLVDLAPAAAVTAVEVKTTTGLVSAAVRDVRASGETLLGTDYVPVGEPGTSLVVPGLPGTVVGAAPARTLYVGVPGTTDATVRVTVTRPDGTIVPTGLDSVAVGAQSVKAIPIGSLIGSQPASVTVTSQPGDTGSAPAVVAGVLVDAATTKPDGMGIHEITYLGAVGPVEGTALIPNTRDVGDTDSVVIASAPQAAVGLTLTATPRGGGTPVVIRRQIAAGTTVAVSMLAAKVQDLSSLRIDTSAGSGPLYVARLIEEDGLLGPLLSAYQVEPTSPEQAEPAVAPAGLAQP